MLISKRITEYRPVLILIVLVLFSLASLASGKRGNILSEAVGTAVSVVAYPFWKVLTGISSGVDYAAGFVTQYSSAQTEAKRLQHKLDAMVTDVSELGKLQVENTRLRKLLDYERENPQYKFLHARVISKSRGTLVIDRGEVHGVQQATVAVTIDGVVGVVTQVEPTIAFVASVYSDQFRMSSVIDRERRVYSVVHGSGSDWSKTCRLNYVDNKNEVRQGDLVYTSGEGLYPSDLLIGRVVEVERGAGMFQNAYMEPTAEPYTLDELLLVTQAQTDARLLAGPAPATETVVPEPETGEKNKTTPPDAVPDMRPLPERYAP
ncbi:MAG: hypothetical protein AMXMBFR84_01890 [Candidatus Hydrogenedentota bacterium]